MPCRTAFRPCRTSPHRWALRWKSALFPALIVLLGLAEMAEARADSLQRAEEGGGFQSNHIMLSGPGGDSVNPFSGDAETVISIGPTLKAGGGLELGLKLYNSTKIWTRYDGDTNVYRYIKRRGAFGVGWKLHLGRIYSSCRNLCNGAADWMYESSDGAQHPLALAQTPDPNASGAITYFGTTDSTFYRAEYYDPNGMVATPPTNPTPVANAYWKLFLGNGVVYTLDHRLKLAGDNNHDNDSADDSDDFRSWYTSSIEKWDTPGHAVGRILITYDTGSSGSLAHCLKKIEFQALNSSGTLTTKRQIDFSNASSLNGSPVEGGYTTSITFPALNGQTSTTATYSLSYQGPQDLTFNPAPNDPNFNTTYANQFLLTKLTYPTLDPNTEAMVMSYVSDPNGIGVTGELERRTLPTGATIKYGYATYSYDATPGSTAQLIYLRRVTTKSLYLGDPNGTADGIWTYGGTPAPSGGHLDSALVTDPFGNDTVYLYGLTACQYNCEPGLPNAERVYRGSASSGVLLRTHNTRYTAGTDGVNVLPIAQWTVHHDEQDKLSGVHYSSLGPFGHFSIMKEYGLVGASVTNELPLQDLPYRQVTQTYEEVAQDPNSNRWKLWNIHRMKSSVTADGAGAVLRRAAYTYTDDGRPLSQRAYFDPAGDPNAGNDEDILTEYVYSGAAPTTSLLERSYVHKDGESSSGFGSRYEYDPNTVMLKKSFVLNSSNPTGATSQAFGYASRELVRDPNSGVVIASINPQGIRSDLYFDQLGRITKSTPDPNGLEFATYIQYPGIRETRVIRPADPNQATDPNSPGTNFSKTRYLYDTLGRVVETRRRTELASSGDCEAIQKKVYDVAGRAEFVSEWGFDSSCDRSPFDGEQEFDPNSYDPNSIASNKNIGTRYLYYTLNGSTRVYDPLGRIQKVIPADHKARTTAYAGMGTTVTVDVAGQDTTAYSELDAFARLSLVDAPLGADARYTYDTLGELLQVELTGPDPNSQAPVTQGRYFTYDGLGRLKSTTNPEDGTVQFSKYDAAGRLLEKVDDAGTKFSFYYDAAGRIVSATATEHATDPNAPTRTLAQYFYDESGITGSAGQLTKMESFDETGTLVSRRSYVYGGRNGRLSEAVTRFGPWDSFAGVSTFGDKQLKLCYFYNQQGQLSQMRYPADANCTENSAPDGVALLNYTYRNGALNAVQDVKRSANLIKSVIYGAPGGVRQLVLGNGKATRIAPDVMSRPEAISVVDPNNLGAAALFQTGHYSFDGSGNILSIGPSDANTIDDFEYDALSRLTAADVYFQDPNGSHVYHETYGYDAFGNMLQKTKQLDAGGAGATTLVASQSSNRLSWLDGVPTSYDATGNYLGTFQRADPNSPLEAVMPNLFDARNRLLAAGASPKAFPVGQYAYDAAGLRIMKAFPKSGERTFYLRDPAGNVLSEFTLPPNKFDEYTQKDYFYALGQVVGMAEEKSPVGVQGLWSSMDFNPGDEDLVASGSVTLNWDKNPDLGIDSDPNGYRIYRKVEASGSWSLLTTTAKTASTYTDGMSGPTIEGQTYFYKIAAINAAGLEGIASRTLKFIMAENSTPAVPTSPTLEKHDHALTLRWQRSSDDSGYANTAGDPQSTFLGYQVYRQETSSGDWLKRNVLPLTEPVFHDLTASDPNIVYYYQVKSVSTAWQESSGAATSNGSPGDDEPPAPPTGFRALSGPQANMITLLWNPSAESDLVDYRVYMKVSGSYTTSLLSKNGESDAAAR